MDGFGIKREERRAGTARVKWRGRGLMRERERERGRVCGCGLLACGPAHAHAPLSLLKMGDPSSGRRKRNKPPKRLSGKKEGGESASARGRRGGRSTKKWMDGKARGGQVYKKKTCTQSKKPARVSETIKTGSKDRGRVGGKHTNTRAGREGADGP